MNQHATNLDLLLYNMVELLKETSQVIFAAVKQRIYDMFDVNSWEIEVVHAESCSDDYVKDSAYSYVFFIHEWS